MIVSKIRTINESFKPKTKGQQLFEGDFLRKQYCGDVLLSK